MNSDLDQPVSLTNKTPEQPWKWPYTLDETGRFAAALLIPPLVFYTGVMLLVWSMARSSSAQELSPGVQWLIPVHLAWFWTFTFMGIYFWYRRPLLSFASFILIALLNIPSFALCVTIMQVHPRLLMFNYAPIPLAVISIASIFFLYPRVYRKHLANVNMLLVTVLSHTAQWNLAEVI